MNIKAAALLLTTAITTMVGGEVKAQYNGHYNFNFMAQCTRTNEIKFCGCVDQLIDYAFDKNIKATGSQIVKICRARIYQRSIPAYRQYHPRPVHPDFKFKYNPYHNPFAGSALQAPSISF